MIIIQQYFVALVCLQAGGSFQETVQTLIKAMKNAEVFLIYSNLKDINNSLFEVLNMYAAIVNVKIVIFLYIPATTSCKNNCQV